MTEAFVRDRILARLRGQLVEQGVSPKLIREFEEAVRQDERETFAEKVKRYL